MSAVAPVSTRLGALLAKDLRGILRDRLMLFLVGYSVVIAAVLRGVVPMVPVEDFGLFVAPAAPLIGSLLVGSVLGFSLVEERESGTWQLLRVLPISDASLGAYLFSLAAGVGLVVGAACALVYGHPVEQPWLYGAALVSAALGAPLLAFFIGSFATNKIEAMAMGKLANIPVAAPLLAFVLPAPWHVLLFWSPFYWVYLALLRGMAPASALQGAPLVVPAVPDAMLVALAVVLLVAGCIPLLRRFRRVAS